MILENFIINLMETDKNILSTPKFESKNNPSHNQINFTLKDTEGNIFEIFMRKNIHLIDRFSIGVIWKSEQGNILLMRYNGKHGPHKNCLDNEIIDGFHVHCYNKKYVDSGFPSDSYAEVTEKYGSFDDAKKLFFEEWNIKNHIIYFQEDLKLF